MAHAERALLAPLLEPVTLQAGASLTVPGEAIDYVVFPESGLAAEFEEPPDGDRVAIGLLGRDGLIGLPALLGLHDAPFRTLVLVEGTASRVPARRLRALANSSVFLRDLVRRQAMAAWRRASVAALCQASHTLEQRTARWLLAVHDRVGPGIPLTQDALAELIGARRPSVNAVLCRLRDAGLIRHGRGALSIIDRNGLHAVACKCHT